MTYVDTPTSFFEAQDGSFPGEDTRPVADPRLWGAVVDRIDTTRARPVLRPGVEASELTGVRGVAYMMLRSPEDDGRARYLRLTPQEWHLALLMDGTLSVARLVAEFARIAGKLSPDQVRRVVADLAANGMLEELPDDAFLAVAAAPAAEPARQRFAGFAADGLATALYRAGGRFLLNRTAATVQALLAAVGIGLFVITWGRGAESLFLSAGSYALGAVVLLALHVVVLAVHELGHALATKRVGRLVGKLGVAISYGLPTLRADTSDVWMAGRRARVLVTVAGPAATLVVAGLAQLVALLVPSLGAPAFKLAFLAYLNVFFHLNPFLALDGSRLLTDWLEIPQLRERGLAWVSARLRRRPPGWGALDREGKVIALYGLLAPLWLAVAANVGWRLWNDRLAGVATGLWHASPAGKLLLIVILLGLFAPLVVLALRRLARAWRAARRSAAEKRRDADGPRRLAALRDSSLGGLPDHVLASLAARARWVHPRTGSQIIVAGTSQQAVYVVVDGALQARRPGDPGGLVRHRVGAGGVVGLANALTGRSTALDWHTAGTTLLAVPTAAVATAIGPLPGAPFDRAEAEELFADTPALSGLAGDERLALIASAHPVDLHPGAPVTLNSPTQAVVVEQGVIAMSDGTELRRGTLIGPVGDGIPGTVAQTRTPVRLWVIPDAADLPPLVGDPGHVVTAPAVFDGGDHPALAAPPGPPEGTENYDVDRRFEKRMWSLALVLTSATVLVTALSFLPGPAWAEMPGNRALLVGDRGTTTALIDGRAVKLAAGDRRYVPRGAQLQVPTGASARLTFTGGATVILCPGAQADLSTLSTDRSRDLTPHAAMTLRKGRILTDTGSTSGAYQPLDLTVTRDAGTVTNDGAAWYALETGTVTVAAGKVYEAGTPSMATEAALSCGDGVVVEPPAGSPSVTPSASSVEPTLDPSAGSVSASVSSSPTPSESSSSPDDSDDADDADADDPADDPTTRPTRTPTSRTPTPTPTRTTAPTTAPTTTAPTTTPPASSASPSASASEDEDDDGGIIPGLPLSSAPLTSTSSAESFSSAAGIA